MRKLLLFTTLSLLMIAPIAVDSQVSTDDGIQRGGIIDRDRIDFLNGKFPWSTLPVNDGFFLYQDHSLKVRSHYGLFKDTQVHQFDITDSFPFGVMNATAYSGQTEELFVIFDLDKSTFLDDGDLVFKIRLGLSESNIFMGFYNNALINWTESPNGVFYHTSWSNNEWKIVFYFNYNFLPYDITYEDNQVLSVVYNDYFNEEFEEDAGFDELVSISPFTLNVESPYFDLAFPSLEPELSANRIIDPVIDDDFFGSISFKVNVVTQGSLYNFKFTESSPIYVKQFSGVRGLIASMKMNQNNVTVIIDEVFRTDSFELVYWINARNGTNYGNQVFPEVHVEFEDLMGRTYQRKLLDAMVVKVVEDKEAYLQSLNGDSEERIDGKSLEELFQEPNPLIELLRQLFLLVLSLVFLTLTYNSFSGLKKSKLLLKQFHDAGKEMILQTSLLVSNTNEEYVKSYLRRALLDLEDVTADLVSKLEQYPGSKDLSLAAYGQLKKKIIERVNLYFASDLMSQKAIEFIKESQLN